MCLTHSMRKRNTSHKFKRISETIQPRVVYVFNFKMFHQEASVETIKIKYIISRFPNEGNVKIVVVPKSYNSYKCLKKLNPFPLGCSCKFLPITITIYNVKLFLFFTIVTTLTSCHSCLTFRWHNIKF